jgi:hydroxypyruvate isomerase
MKLSACIEYLFAAECPSFPDRIYASQREGLDAVEFHLWRDKPLEKIRAALDETGLTLSAIVVEPRCRLTDPGAHAGFLQALNETLATARQLGAQYVIPSVGPVLAGVPLPTQREAIVAALSRAVQLAGDAGVRLLLEPINSAVDHPGMYLTSTTEGLDIIEQVGAPNLRLLYDIYHSATMGETPESLFAGREQLLGYVQVADSPGRHEPGSGKIDWPRYLRLLDSLGYEGTMGLEYRPLHDTLGSLESTRRSLGLVR